MKKDEEIDEEMGLLEIPPTLNFSVSTSVFDLIEIPELLLVDYQEFDKSKIEKRLPAGRFHVIKDLLPVIDTFLKKGRNQSLEYLYQFANTEFTSYLSFVKNHKESHREQNDFFDYTTEKILGRLQLCNLNEKDFKKILNQTYLNTAIRELKEETGAEKIGKIYFSSYSKAWSSKSHYQIGCVSVEVEAPIIYQGSPDTKIKKSYWTDINEDTQDLLFEGHKIKFQEGIRTAIQLGVPNSEKLERFLTAVQ